MTDVPRGTREKLEHLLALVMAENERQNLIGPGTPEVAWIRHVEDSLQLLPLAGHGEPWVDIGTGAGFPGLVIAVADPRPIVLVEPRRRRSDFLGHAAKELGCTNVTIRQEKVQAVRDLQAGVISARAVASLTGLLEAAHHLASPETIWLLPKGRGATEELAEARRSWQGEFHIEASRTDPTSGIVVAHGVARKGRT